MHGDIMAKSDDIPIVTPNREYDNPFNDQTAFSPPQMNLFDRMTIGDKGADQPIAELVGGRERSTSSPVPTKLRNPVEPLLPSHDGGVNNLIRNADERGNSNPNLTTSKFNSPPIMHPVDRTFSHPVSRDALEPEAIRGFHSAPVTPCQTPIGSRQGSPKAERRKGGRLLEAIFGAGIYGRQVSDGIKPGPLGHLAEDNEDDSTPVGSPKHFTIDELKTKLQGVDDRVGPHAETTTKPAQDVDVDLFGEPHMPPRSVSGVVGNSPGAITNAAANMVAGKKATKKKKGKEDNDYSYRELTFISPSST